MIGVMKTISKANNTFKLASVERESRNITNKMKSMLPDCDVYMEKKDTNNGEFLARLSFQNEQKLRIKF